MALIDHAAKKTLLQRARHAIARAIGAPIPGPPLHVASVSDQAIRSDVKAGAFVTLRLNGHLRGCIGYPESDLPLVDVIERCALSAAISDPRFPPVTPDEWSGIDLEVSVLGPIEPVGDVKDVIVGRHGVIVEFGRRRGLLLPQVAIEWSWSAEELASQACAKAGLPRDAWRKGAKLFKFEAEVFGESDESFTGE
jgi:AmmeMemoRadiSam system protein A